MSDEYELIVFDLDGTLLGPDLKIDPRVVEQLHRLRAHGVQTTLATGRILKAAAPFIEQLDIDIPVILYNGAVIIDPETRKILYQQRLPRESAALALRLVKDYDLHPELYVEPTDDVFYVEKITEPIARFIANDRIAGVEVEDLEALLTVDPIKILIVGDRATELRFRDRYLAHRPVATITLSGAPGLPLLEVLPPKASKGTALIELCQRLGVPLERTVAFGDNMNDAEMLTAAGLGVAMADAPEALRTQAGLIAEDGIHQILEAIFSA
ncbi:MAG: HAD family hydrolase [Candidatus Bipolaricaulia bacterium]